MVKEKENTENESNKKSGFFVRQVKVYKRYFMFKSSTKRILGKRLTPKDFKEIYKAYTTLEEPKKSFKRAMEVEGVVESDLEIAHKRYNIFNIIILISSIVPFYHCFNVINHKIAGSEFTLGFIPSLFPSLVSLMFLSFFYVYFCWLQWRIRNKLLFTHLTFLSIIKSFPDELMPFQDYHEDKMENKYKKKWDEWLTKKAKKSKKEFK